MNQLGVDGLALTHSTRKSSQQLGEGARRLSPIAVSKGIDRHVPTGEVDRPKPVHQLDLNDVFSPRSAPDLVAVNGPSVTEIFLSRCTSYVEFPALPLTVLSRHNVDATSELKKATRSPTLKRPRLQRFRNTGRRTETTPQYIYEMRPRNLYLPSQVGAMHMPIPHLVTQEPPNIYRSNSGRPKSETFRDRTPTEEIETTHRHHHHQPRGVRSCLRITSLA